MMIFPEIEFAGSVDPWTGIALAVLYGFGAWVVYRRETAGRFESNGQSAGVPGGDRVVGTAGDRIEHRRWWGIRRGRLRQVEQGSIIHPMSEQGVSRTDRRMDQRGDGRREAHRARVWLSR